MRHYPEDEDEMKEALEDMACQPWMVEQLRRNPDYPHWGPHEDYQWVRDPDDPDSPREFFDWAQFKRCFTVGHHPTDVADRSGGEIVNWYFSLDRRVHQCRDCQGSGLNRETKRLSDEWYDHLHPKGNGWSKRLTQDEVDALQNEGRLREMCSMCTLEELERVVAAGKISRAEAERRWEARDREKDRETAQGEVFNLSVYWRDQVPADEVNEAYRDGIGHDAINHWICTEVRARRLGVYGKCPTCEGKARIVAEDTGRLELVLWVVNPATGQNYGVEVLSVREEDLPEIYEFVLGCGRRLAEHLDLPDLASFKDVKKVARPESVMWSQNGSCLDGDPRYPHSWRAPVYHGSWKDMRAVRDWRGDLVSPEDERYERLGKGWDLDCYNELIGIYFEPDPHGSHPGHLHAWVAHPRKGCSRRITVQSYDEDDLADIAAWAREGRERTLERFACRPSQEE